MPSPLIGISCCIHMLDVPIHAVAERYIQAVTKYVGGIPILLPAIGFESEENSSDVNYCISKLDGLLLTGSVSNIEPYRYNQEPIADDILYDSYRDSTTIPLICKAVELNLPVLGICRGLQEINVALGGSLVQDLKASYQEIVHSPLKSSGISEKYLPKHTVELTPMSWMASVLQWHGIRETAFMTNSLHSQAIQQLGEGLSIEAQTSDGLIEMVRLNHPDKFVVGVQWHPEWFVDETPLYKILFQEFRAACIRRM